MNDVDEEDEESNEDKKKQEETELDVNGKKSEQERVEQSDNNQ